MGAKAKGDGCVDDGCVVVDCDCDGEKAKGDGDVVWVGKVRTVVWGAGVNVADRGKGDGV